MSKLLAVAPGVIQALYSNGPVAPVEEVKQYLFQYCKDYALATDEELRKIIKRCAREMKNGYCAHPDSQEDDCKRVIEFYNDCFVAIK